jgi:hypothetical protein
MTDDELCRRNPMPQMTFTLASLPCQRLRMPVEGRHAVVCAAENPSCADRKYYACHPSCRKSPIRMRFGRNATAAPWPSAAESMLKKKIEEITTNLLNGNQIGRSQLRRIMRRWCSKLNVSASTDVIALGKSSTTRYFMDRAPAEHKIDRTSPVALRWLISPDPSRQSRRRSRSRASFP